MNQTPDHASNHTSHAPGDVEAELPRPTAELYLVGAVIEALMAELPPERRRHVVDRISSAFERHDELVAGIRPRPDHQQMAVGQARNLARNWWTWIRPLLLTAANRP